MNKKYFLNTLLIFSLIALLSAYYIQYILGHQPCALCKLQRIPYMVSIILIFYFLIFKNYEKPILFALFISFSVGSIISFYHSGIEYGLFEESVICKLNETNNAENAKELLKNLKRSIISCKDVTFRIFGQSLATLNTIFSLIISVILISLILNRNEKNK